MTLRMVKISLLSLLISLPGAVFAQDNLDSFPVQSKKEYDDFVEKSKADFNNFSSKARQDYKDFASRISQQIQKTKEQKSANLPQEQRAETTRFKIPVFLKQQEKHTFCHLWRLMFIRKLILWTPLSK